jgi:hypothetical protein
MYRFEKGTEVLCCTGDHEWSRGVIVALNHREPNWPRYKGVPYQVQLHDGRLVFAPFDVDECCRKVVPPWWECALKKSANFGAALMEVVTKMWLNGISQLISMKDFVNMLANHESCTIQFASAQAQDTVQFLLDASATSNSQEQNHDHDPAFTSKPLVDNSEQKTLLQDSDLNGDAEAAKAFFETQARIDIQDAQHKSPLRSAIKTMCMDLLLRLGADTNQGNHCSSMEDLPLVNSDDEEFVKESIAAKTDIKIRGKQRRKKNAGTFLCARADTNQDSADETALKFVCKNSRVDAYKVLDIWCAT